MHPIVVIRASCTAPALRLDRELTSNVCHKKPSSNVIVCPLLSPILSTLIISIHKPSSTPSRRPFPIRLNHPSSGNLLTPGCQLGRIRPPCSSAPLSLNCPPLSEFFGPDGIWLPQSLHRLGSDNSRISELLAAMQHTVIATNIQAEYLSYTMHWLHLEHIHG